MKDLNYKTPRRKHSGKLYDIDLGNDFRNMTPRSSATESQKIVKWD